MPSPDHRFSHARFIQDIATLLQLAPEELALVEDPFDAGLDSVRLMVLVEQWRKQGVDIAFVELASRRSLSAWWALIEPQLP